MINKIHFPFPTHGEIFTSPKQVMEEKIAKKETTPTLEVITPKAAETSLVTSSEQILTAMQAQSVALDMLRLKVTRKTLHNLEEEQPSQLAA